MSKLNLKNSILILWMRNPSPCPHKMKPSYLLILVGKKKVRKIDEGTFLSKILSFSSEEGKLKDQANSSITVCLLSPFHLSSTF